MININQMLILIKKNIMNMM